MYRPRGEFALPSTRYELAEGVLRVARFRGPAEAGPTLICVPGYGATGESFARLAPLADRLDVHLLTPPEDAKRRPDVLKQHGALVAEYARRFDGPLLLGTSFGGPIAIEAAAQLGDALRGLILISTYAWLRHPLRFFRPILPLLEAIARLLQPLGVFAIGGPGLDHAAARELLRQVNSISMREKHARLVAALTCNAEGSARKIRAPVLIIHGTSDRVVRLSRGRAMARLFDDVEMHEIEGAGHVPYLTHPRVIVDYIDAFARRISHSR